MINNNVEMLNFICETGYECTEFDFIHAIDRGKKEIVEYLFEKNCPTSRGVFIAAMKQKDFDFMEKLYSRNCPWDADLYLVAGDFEDFRWLYAHHCPVDSRFMNRILMWYSRDVLDWAIKNKFPADLDSVRLAFRYGGINLYERVISLSPQQNEIRRIEAKFGLLNL
jgi:hypothetical protein